MGGSAALPLAGERFREQRANRRRLGARRTLTPALDVGRSAAPSSTTPGLTWTFQR